MDSQKRAASPHQTSSRKLGTCSWRSEILPPRSTRRRSTPKSTCWPRSKHTAYWFHPYLILDNKNTAMTGHQPTPESGHNLMGDKTTPQDIESIVRAMGQGQIYVKKMPPSNREKYMKELDKVFEKPGVKVIIADKECGITFHKRKRSERNRIIERQGFVKKETFVNISQEVCENCRECTKNTGCPGLTIIDTDYGEKIGIDQSICVSDTYCTKVMACPSFEKVIITRNRPPKSRVKKISLDNI